MIDFFSIQDFKGIRRCAVENLGAVNVFVGKNDSCKSTIMEAIHATLNEFNASNLGLILSRRSNVRFGGRELWYNYVTKHGIKVEVNIGGRQTLVMYIRYDDTSNAVTSNTQIEHVEPDKSRRIIYAGTSAYYGPSLSQSSRSGRPDFLVSLPERERETLKYYLNDAISIDSSSRNDLRYIEQLLRDIKLKGLENEFGQFLHETYGTSKKWEFMPHPDIGGETRLTQRFGNRYLFLTGLGDGIRNAMIVVAEIMLRKNTAIFIEEMENNQHPASLGKLIRILVDTAKKNNLQVFITTHSHYAWRNFEQIFGKANIGKGKLQIFHVVREPTNGTVTCKPLTEKEVGEWMTEVDKDLLECKY
jgi:predicted ATPase